MVCARDEDEVCSRFGGGRGGTKESRDQGGEKEGYDRVLYYYYFSLFFFSLSFPAPDSWWCLMMMVLVTGMLIVRMAE